MSTKILSELWEGDLPVYDTARMLLFVLADAADQESRQVWLGVPVLVGRVGRSQAGIYRALALLQDCGILQRVAQEQRCERARAASTTVWEVTPRSRWAQKPVAVGNEKSRRESVNSEAILTHEKMGGAAKPARFSPMRNDLRTHENQILTHENITVRTVSEPLREELRTSFVVASTEDQDCSRSKAGTQPVTSRSATSEDKDPLSSVSRDLFGEPVPVKRRPRPRPWSLAQRFDSGRNPGIVPFETNLTALASNFGKWIRTGITEEEIEEMIRLFWESPQKAEIEPWREFLSRKLPLLTRVRQGMVRSRTRDDLIGDLDGRVAAGVENWA